MFHVFVESLTSNNEIINEHVCIYLSTVWFEIVAGKIERVTEVVRVPEGLLIIFYGLLYM